MKLSVFRECCLYEIKSYSIMENSKLLLGIGLGAIVGSLVTCFAKSAKGQKMRKDLSSSFHELEGDAEDILCSAKEKAQSTGQAIANKVTGKYNYAKGRVEEKLNNLSEELNKG